MTQPDQNSTKDSEPAKEEKPPEEEKPKDAKSEKEKKDAKEKPLPRPEWELPDEEKFDPRDYGGSPFGGSTTTIPEPDGFW